MLKNPARVGQAGYRRSVSWTESQEDDLKVEATPASASASTSTSTSMDVDIGAGTGLIIFRVSHKHPHRLKRPLQHSDSLTGTHFAIRLYQVASQRTLEFEDGAGPQLIVQRTEAADIQLIEFFGKARIKPEKLIHHFLQWTVEPALRLEAGQQWQQGQLLVMEIGK